MEALSNIGKFVSGAGKTAGNVLHHIGKGAYEVYGGGMSDIERRQAEADIGYRKAMTNYYEAGGAEGGGRAWEDRAISILLKFGDIMEPEMRDGLLTAVLKSNKKLGEIYEDIHGKGVLKNRNITINEVESFRRFRDSFESPFEPGTAKSGDEENYDNASKVYEYMFNQLAKVYGPKPKPKIEIPPTKSQEPVTFDWRTGKQISGKALTDIAPQADKWLNQAPLLTGEESPSEYREPGMGKSREPTGGPLGNIPAKKTSIWSNFPEIDMLKGAYGAAKSYTQGRPPMTSMPQKPPAGQKGPMPNMNNPFVKGKPPKPEEALTWPPAPKEANQKVYYDQIMEIWYSMPSEIEYMIYMALDQGATWNQIYDTPEIQQYLKMH